MTGQRWPLVVGSLAIAGGIAWFALRRSAPSESASPGPSPSGSNGLTTPPPTAAVPHAPAPPVLPTTDTPRPALPTGSVSGSAAAPDATAQFEAQDRDPRWAPKTETELKRRFQTIHGGHLDATECRESQCELVISGTQGELGQTITEIDDPKGLHGFAKTILLTAPLEHNGKLVMRAYATFER